MARLVGYLNWINFVQEQRESARAGRATLLSRDNCRGIHAPLLNRYLKFPLDLINFIVNKERVKVLVIYHENFSYRFVPQCVGIFSLILCGRSKLYIFEKSHAISQIILSQMPLANSR